MALNTTPAEAAVIHTRAALAARDIASKWISSSEYRNSNERFRASIRAALAVFDAGVSVPALEVNRYLAEAWVGMNPYTSDYDKLSSTIESEILGYAIEAQDQETRELFEEVAAS